MRKSSVRDLRNGEIDGEKRRLRKRIKEIFKRKTPEELKEKSRVIKEILFFHPFYREAGTIFTYISFQKEVDTLSLIDESLRKGKEILVPWVEDGGMTPVVLKNIRELAPGKWGIPEPVMKIPVPSQKIDLVLVPGIAFDRRGNRLGRGGGYFDRFLSSIPQRIRKVALAYSFQIVERVPVTPQDVPVDEVITEEGEVLEGERIKLALKTFNQVKHMNCRVDIRGRRKGYLTVEFALIKDESSQNCEEYFREFSFYLRDSTGMDYQIQEFQEETPGKFRVIYKR